jgi:hypothetical protein
MDNAAGQDHDAADIEPEHKDHYTAYAAIECGIAIKII